MSDPSSSEAQRFEPSPDQRRQWKAPYKVDSESPDATTPERWFEPSPSPDNDGGDPGLPSGSGYGRGIVGVLFATSLVAALLGAGGTYAALRYSGVLSTATAAPAPTSPSVSVESDESTVIAAIAAVSSAVVQIVTTDAEGNTSVGSGLIYDPRGWILTNKHVVATAKTMTIRLKDDRHMPATVYGMDTLTDLAIIKVEATGLVAAPIGDSSSLQVGELAIAIGSPLGLQYPNTVTTGIVSALGRDISIASDDAASPTPVTLHGLIQTDAAINPGNSGGPLVDGSGRVIGIATAEVDSGQGIGFAIPINIAKPIMQQALAGEPLSRPFIGVTYVLIDPGIKERYKLPLDQGAWVHREDANGVSMEAVTSGSPGDLAGIMTGDIITEIESQPIDQSHRLEDIIVQYAPGRTVSLEVYRDGIFVTRMITLGTRPPNAA
ncbi:MAG TPA: trypsin-like peptidase domain-containing protein [Candidatus Limnocylindrales bacterium]